MFYTDGHFDVGDDAYYWSYGIVVSDNPAYIDIDTDTLNPCPTYIDEYDPAAGPFWTCNTVRNGENSFGVQNTDWVPIYVDDNDGSVGSCYGAYAINGVTGIQIQGSASGNWDQWDNWVILHEFAHAWMDHNAELAPIGGAHTFHRPAPPEPLYMAWNEGFAHFYPAVALSDPHLIDYDNNMGIAWDIEIEHPEPDVPYTDYWPQTSPSLALPIYEGCTVEGSVAETLWDKFDAPDDGDWYVGGQVWGNNEDYNSGAYWQGLDYILDILLYHDPDPSDPNHNNCWTMYEFFDGWLNQGWGQSTVFRDLCEAHCTVGFVAGNMDNSSDQQIDISDLVFMIDFMFVSGPFPDHPSSADVTADKAIDISDLVYLVDYMFTGGDPLKVGRIPWDDPNWTWDPTTTGCTF